MNTSPIAHRYAKALLKFVQERGTGNIVYSQALILVLRLQEIPTLADVVLKNSELSLERKVQLMNSALGEQMQDELCRFVVLVHQRKRIDLFLRILSSFIDQYRCANLIKVGRLVTASAVSGLRENLQSILSESLQATVFLEEEINPKILGGFVFELDGSRLDASVEGHLDRIRRCLVQNNNRII